ncbi:methyltransferase-like 26 [Crassostrea virginica]|uniref:Methyltransferase-like 26 n=1 Tax=Crassostrea virginica TaxID=6565 RepID=A0A8B8CQB1_CRAVI|nr:methyltransferase-like 26 [Crassostrea virginica]XP_022317587.1 methyltransferase-like 26 [Crassostrea virginica]XP_022317588.1 methyltransferase-like 26 [Crassostrea virginica]XP_022317969.1 methyltransferase-like 26 [Crassostrea virginica]XP_022317970.1 methyltransferase-like 26 [Crassostrea virginica]XP_022317971.1 methyltransferase-like 26 [Crassostrea virginica]XP_022317973.1 methyltransferase-like 26 [Crassostrea virginica]
MLQFPAAERNKEPMLNVLKEHLPVDQEGQALEIASGSGTHVALFAQHFPLMSWQPTEIDQKCLQSISAYKDHYGLQNVKEPFPLDVTSPVESWNAGSFQACSLDAVVNMNMIHISPWDTAIGLFKGCGTLLKSGGLLFLYGPFAVHGNLTPESNISFDASLRQRDSRWGVRDVEDVEKLALQNNMSLLKTVDMPANNKTLVFKKA